MFEAGGTATFKGEPTAGAPFSFRPPGDPDPRALRAQATADKDGRFRMTTCLTGDGAPAGEYAVTTCWPGRKPKGEVGEPGEGEDPLPDRLNRAHADPKTINFTLP